MSSEPIQKLLKMIRDLDGSDLAHLFRDASQDPGPWSSCAPFRPRNSLTNEQVEKLLLPASR